MNVRGAMLWGFVATIVLTTVQAGAQAAGWSRMSLPFMLGTMLTSARERARGYGILVHLLNGWLFAFVYAAAFESWQRAGVLRGMLTGVVHALFVLTVGIPALTIIHPRMASEDEGPTPTRQLEPPGFMGLHYGRQTPMVLLAAHLVYGAILGAFYRPLTATGERRLRGRKRRRNDNANMRWR